MLFFIGYYLETLILYTAISIMYFHSILFYIDLRRLVLNLYLICLF